MSRPTYIRVAAAALLLFVSSDAATVVTPARATAAPDASVGPSGLPLPRFVSLKSGRVNSRIGPGVNYPVDWLYLKPGLPMEIIQEYDNWRRVRDSDGSEGLDQPVAAFGQAHGDHCALAARQGHLDSPARGTRAGRRYSRRHRAGGHRQDQPVQWAMVRDDVPGSHRLAEPVAGVGCLSRRVDQGLDQRPIAGKIVRLIDQPHCFRRSRTTMSTLAISMPSGGSGRLITLTGASAMSNTLFSPST